MTNVLKIDDGVTGYTAVDDASSSPTSGDQRSVRRIEPDFDRIHISCLAEDHHFSQLSLKGGSASDRRRATGSDISASPLRFFYTAPMGRWETR
jgi:hypothetical protein